MIQFKFYFFLLLMTLNFAEAKTLEIVKEHSKVGFEVDYMKVTTVSGLFSNFSGTFDWDSNRIKNLNFEIEASSINTDNKKRDFHLKTQEFLFVSKYKSITFNSKDSILLRENEKFTLAGDIELRGIKKRIVFNGIYKGKLIDPWKKENYFFNLNAKLNRKDFGIVWNKFLDNEEILLGEEVRIQLTIQAQNQGETTSFSTHMVPSTKGVIERDLLKKGKIKKLTTPTGQK